MLFKLLDGFLLQSYYEHMNSCSYVRGEKISGGKKDEEKI